MNITAENIVKELVAGNINCAKIFEKYHIDYCCGGNISLEEACKRNDLDLNEVIATLNAEAKGNAPEDDDLNKRSIPEIIDHILEVHHEKLKEALPRIRDLLSKNVKAHGKQRQELFELQDVYTNLMTDIENHLMKEENVLFPAAKQLASGEGQAMSLSAPIEVMLAEHDNVGNALAKIRELTHDYQLPENPCNTYRALFAALEELELGTHLHVHKENNILFPKIIAMQQSCNQAATD